MKTKILPLLAVFFICGLLCNSAIAQLTGIKTIDNLQPTGGNNYNSFTDAFNALNSDGVGTGGVTFNVVAGQTFNELPPVLNATGTVSDQIIFIKNGGSDNPEIIPNVPGTLSTTTFGSNADGIIIVNGGDYITFNGIDLSTALDTNTGTTEKYEYGYYFKKASGTNACKNVTVKNSTISLQQTIGTQVSIGCAVFVSNISGTSTVTVTSSGGVSENFDISSNTIRYCKMGIQIRGFNATTFRDLNNQIGVNGGNSISEFGGAITITTYGIYTTFQENIKIANNIVTSKFTSGFSFQGITTDAGTNSNVEIYGNTITLTGSNTFYCIRNSMGSTGTNNSVKIYNNVITGCVSTGGGAFEIYLTNNSSSCNRLYINNNQYTSNEHGGSSQLNVIDQSGSVTDSCLIYGNSIIGNTKTIGTTPIRLIQNTTSGTTARSAIYDNLLTGNIHQGTGIIYCINHSSGNTSLIYRNSIYNNISAGRIIGIFVTMSSGNTSTSFNNLIKELYTPDGIRIDGVELQGSGTHRLYYNTIYLDSSSTSTAFESSVVYHNATSGSLDLRNNIFINLTRPGLDPEALSVVLRRNTTATTNYASSSNNNNFYAGTPGPKYLIHFDGTNSDQSIDHFKNRIAPKDNNSFTESSPFKNVSTHPYDVRLDSTIATGCESGGVVISSPSITSDYFKVARYPNAGHPVNPGFSPTAPDIGASEFGGIYVDIISPVISYTALGPTSSLSNRQLTAIITDQAGVSTGSNLPRLYFKKNTSGTYSFDDNPMQVGNNYTWTIDYSVLGGTAYDDRIEYYVAAQDVNGNLSSVPGGATGINPPGTSPTTSPNFYDIYNPDPMSGTYIIGYGTFNQLSGINLKFEKRISQAINEFGEVEEKIDNVTLVNGKVITEPIYYELTANDKTKGELRGIEGVFPNFYAAILNLNLRGINGPVTFLLDDESYSNETFPLVIDVVIGSSSSNTITFKPNTGVTPNISGSSTNAIIKFNGADNIILDGSNTSEGASRDLTIINEATTTNSAAIWFSSLGTNAGAMNNIIKNCNISAGVDMSVATTSTYGIVTSGTTTGSQVSINDGDGNNNNSFINNRITKCRYAMHLQGATNLNTNIVIADNEIGADEFGSETIGLGGIILLRHNGVSVTGNTIKYIGGTFATTSSSGSRIGIGLGNNSVTGTSAIMNANVSGNTIYEIRDERAGNAAGIVVGATGTNTNNMIYNNVMHTILANISLTASRCWGIGLVAGDNDKILFNSINMTGDLDPPGSSATANQNAAGIRITSNTAVTNLTLMNNVVSVDLNSDNTGVRHFCIIAPATNYNWGTGAMNYNDYYYNNANSQMATGGIGTAAASMLAYQNLSDWRNEFSQLQDKKSMSRNPGFTSDNNLLPDVSNSNSWHLSGMGQIIANISSDINGNTRNTHRLNGGVDIGAYEFNPNTSTISPPVTLSEEIAVGRIQEMFFADRKIGEIEWVSGSALPSALDVKFKAGINPPLVSSPPQVSNAYWTAEQTGGTEYVYNLRLDYDINQAGNIPYESSIKISKLNNTTWSLLGNSIVDTTARTVTSSGLNSFSSFALTTTKLSLNIAVIPEGMYNTGTGMLHIRDTVRAYLRSISSPYALVDSAIAVVDSVTLTASFDFNNASEGTYYIMVAHRNSIRTWSKSGGEFIAYVIQNNYDFTTAASQAFGNNQILKGSKYCIFSGDVNQDDVIEASDLGIIDNDTYNFLTGYVPSDLNGDYLVDGNDAAIGDNNAANFIGMIGPP